MFVQIWPKVEGWQRYDDGGGGRGSSGFVVHEGRKDGRRPALWEEIGRGDVDGWEERQRPASWEIREAAVVVVAVRRGGRGVELWLGRTRVNASEKWTEGRGHKEIAIRGRLAEAHESEV